MKRTFKQKIIDTLVNMYAGVVSFKIGSWYASACKPTILIYMIIFGILKTIEALKYGYVTMTWWTIVLLVLLIPQLLFGFSMILINWQTKVYNESKNKER